MNIDKIIDTILELPKESKNVLKESITEVAYPKGHILLKTDKIEPTIYFIKKGIIQ